MVASPWIHALAAAGAILAAASAAQACEVPNPLRPELVVLTPVVVRGEVVAILPTEHGGAELTVVVSQTYKGTEAATWSVKWSAWSVIAAPTTLEAFVARYGTDVVLGLTPDVLGIVIDHLPDRLDSGAGALAQEVCAEPFLGSYTDLAPMLDAGGLL